MTISSDQAALSDLRDINHPLFDTYKVDLVVAGHNHNMQRTYPVTHNTSSPSSPTIVSTASNNIVTDINGRIFINSGAGGRALDSLGSTPSHYAFANDEDFGFLFLEWSNNNKKLIGKFMTSPTAILDTFEVNKTS